MEEAARKRGLRAVSRATSRIVHRGELLLDGRVDQALVVAQPGFDLATHLISRAIDDEALSDEILCEVRATVVADRS